MSGVFDGNPAVLVDTNTIIEAHRVSAWAALSGGYRIETVEECVAETQTGFQRRTREETIDARELRAKKWLDQALSELVQLEMRSPRGCA